jgi:ubiquinone/menaquinone biosynthesis C-methylase UbiE
MSGSLPEMGDWDAVFDETYLRIYEPMASDERAREQALAAVALAGAEPGAEILDCPCGYARHSLPLAEAGYRVTGLDRSESQLAEAERRRGDAEWPRLVRGDYRELPFEDASFDAALCLFSSLGYLERDDDVGVLRELRRVLRPDGAVILETAHRDALARSMEPPRTWYRLDEDAVLLEERTADWAAGTLATYRLIVSRTGEWIERPYVLHVYSAKEWLEMLQEAGFREAEAFGAWDGATPTAPEHWRLILRARESPME